MNNPPEIAVSMNTWQKLCRTSVRFLQTISVKQHTLAKETHKPADLLPYPFRNQENLKEGFCGEGRIAPQVPDVIHPPQKHIPGTDETETFAPHFPEPLTTVLPIRIGKKSRAKIRELAHQSGQTESHYVRQLIFISLAQATTDPKKRLYPKQKPSSLPFRHPSPEEIQACRITIRLPRFLLEQVKHHAGQKGMSTNRWIASLIQSALLSIPVMTETEVSALRECNYQLMAIGRNLNQITRSIHTGQTDKGLSPSFIDNLKETLFRTETNISQLISASRQSWGQDAD
jgi:hypothetical protein